MSFLWAYAERFAAETPLAKQSNRMQFEHQCNELNSAEIFAEIRDFADSYKDKKTAQKADSRIIEIGNHVRGLALKKDSGLELSTVLGMYGYSRNSMDKRFETVEIWAKAGKIRSYGDYCLTHVFTEAGIPYIERTAAVLNMIFSQDKANPEKYKQGNAHEFAISLAFNHSKFYDALEPRLEKELQALVRYQGTPVVRTSAAHFSSKKNPVELLETIPEHWSYLAIFAQNKNGIKGTKNAVVNRIPTSLGLKHDEDVKNYDKNLTSKFIEQDGVFENYVLVALNKGEAKMVKTALLPKILAKGYEIISVNATEQSCHEQGREYERFYDWRNDAGANLQINKLQKTPNGCEIVLRTRYDTKDEDVQHISKGLALQSCEHQSR